MRENHIQVHGGVLGECCALVGRPVTSRASRPWVWTSQMMCLIVGKVNGSVRTRTGQVTTTNKNWWVFRGGDQKKLKKKADFFSGVEEFFVFYGTWICFFFSVCTMGVIIMFHHQHLGEVVLDWLSKHRRPSPKSLGITFGWSLQKWWWQVMDKKRLKCAGWWFQIFFMFTPKIGGMIHCDLYFSDGLKPPTSVVF